MSAVCTGAIPGSPTFGSADVRTDFERFLGYYSDGELDLDNMITRRIDLGEVNDALHSLGDADVIRQVIEH